MTDNTKVVTVTCSNHHRELTNGLWNLLQTNYGLDHELKCGERSVRVHGVVLQAFLSTSGSAHLAPVQKDSEIVKQEPLPSDDLLLSVLEFLYKGTVTLNRELLNDLQDIAEQLDFRLLVDAVEKTKQCTADELIIPRVDEMPPKTMWKSRLLRSEVENLVQSVFSGSEPDVCDGPNAFLAAQILPVDLPQSEVLPMVQKCYSCDFESASIALLAFHQASQHDDPSILIYRCSQCREKSVTEAEMEEHCRHCDIDEPNNGKVKHGLETIICKYCCRIFESEESLDEHVTNHPTFDCTASDFESHNVRSLRGHQKRAHGVESKGNAFSELKCSECNYSTAFDGCFRRHMRTKHPRSKAIVCKYCLRKFQSEDALTEHLANHRKSKCALCDFETLSHARLLGHRKCIHRIDAKGNSVSEIECPHCDYSTMLNSRLKKHMQQMHPDPMGPAKSEVLRCKFCTCRFKSDRDLAEHMTDHPKYRCTLCNYESHFKSNLSDHRKSTHRVDAKGNAISELKCFQCDYTTMLNARLMIHIQQRHPDPVASTTGLFKCKRCYKKFESKESCDEHMTNHRKYGCTLCSYKSHNRSSLTDHRKCVHHVDAKGNPISEIKCSECDFSAFTDTRLKQHVRLKHTALLAFKCKVCTRLFQSEKSLDEHMTKHPMHKCDLCVFESQYIHNLPEHRKRIHHIDEKGNPLAEIKCSECDYSVVSDVRLKQHMRLKHSGSKVSCVDQRKTKRSRKS